MFTPVELKKPQTIDAGNPISEKGGLRLSSDELL